MFKDVYYDNRKQLKCQAKTIEQLLVNNKKLKSQVLEKSNMSMQAPNRRHNHSLSYDAQPKQHTRLSSQQFRSSREVKELSEVADTLEKEKSLVECELN